MEDSKINTMTESYQAALNVEVLLINHNVPLLKMFIDCLVPGITTSPSAPFHATTQIAPS